MDDLAGRLESWGYDQLYCSYWTLKNLIDIEGYRQFSKNRFDSSLEGYMFLLEVSLLKIISALELTTENDKLSEMLTWGDIDLGNSAFQELKNKDPTVYFILAFNNHRRLIKKIRVINPINKEFMKSEFICLDSLLNDTYEKYFSHLEKHDSAKYENYYILLNLILHLNYIESGFPVYEPVYPVGIISSTTPKKVISEYNLSSDTLKLNEKSLVSGYASGLSYLYAKLGFESETYNILNSAKSWKSLHKTWVRIKESAIEPFEKENNIDILCIKIFNIREKLSVDNTYDVNSTIKNSMELFRIFRGRRTRYFKLEENYTRTQTICYDLILGELFRQSEGKLEIIEITEDFGDRSYCTYAIYSGLSGFAWDASEWFVFHAICPAKDKGYQSTFQVFLYNYFEKFKNSIELRKFKIKEGILLPFIKKYDPRAQRSINKNSIMSELFGLTSELIAYYIFTQTAPNGYVIRLRENVSNKTDCDLICVLPERIIIVQVKTHTKNYDHNNVENNFSEIIRDLPKYLEKNKISIHNNIEKIVFFVKRDNNSFTVEKQVRELGATPVFLQDKLDVFSDSLRKKIFDIFSIKDVSY